MKAIDTTYKGYRFRSRLEARWAVFFDALGIEYEYEKEGFDLGKAGAYLPDFWLPEFRLFCEIKSKHERPDVPDWISQCWDETLVNPVDILALLATLPRAERLAFALADQSFQHAFAHGDDPPEHSSVDILYGDPGSYIAHVYYSMSGLMTFSANEYRFAQCARGGGVQFGGGPLTLYGMATCCACCFWSDDTDGMRQAIRAARSARFERGATTP